MELANWKKNSLRKKNEWVTDNIEDRGESQCVDNES